MKKIFVLMMAMSIIMFEGSSWAGPNFFSSDNEQYGLLAGSWALMATMQINAANAYYTNYMLAYYSGDSATADEMYDAYEEAYEEATDAAQKADEYYDKISITVSTLISLDLDGPPVVPLLKFDLKKRERLE